MATPMNRGEQERALRRAPVSGEVVNRACCGGRDCGPMREDEGPSEADLERFGDVTQHCPECKAELYDDAEVCYKCGHALSASPHKAMPVWMIVIVIVLAASLAGVLALR